MDAVTEDPRNPLQIKVAVKVPANLVLQLPDGTTRPPTLEELSALRLKPEDQMRKRLISMLAALKDDEDDDTISALRYFVDYVITYDHEAPDDAIEGLRARLIWDDPA